MGNELLRMALAPKTRAGAPLRSLLAGLAAGSLTLVTALDASAFCRTTTCDTADPEEVCTQDTSGCVLEGLPLIWPEACLSFGVHVDGSPRRRISWEEATFEISEAYREWMSADCDGFGSTPTFAVWDLGEVYCSTPEFNQNQPNVNAWIFRDDDWPYRGQASTLALTTITFEVPTGEVLDADVEVNSFAIELTTSETSPIADLRSIATHEVGHFLGLAHSLDAKATMNANYEPRDLSFRTLDPDDVDGVCEIYPPDRDVPQCDGPRPRHGFSRHCAEPVESSGCSCTTEPPRSSRWWATGLIGVALGLARGRRRRVPR